jgi:hypothetical protein
MADTYGLAVVTGASTGIGYELAKCSRTRGGSFLPRVTGWRSFRRHPGQAAKPCEPGSSSGIATAALDPG